MASGAGVARERNDEIGQRLVGDLPVVQCAAKRGKGSVARIEGDKVGVQGGTQEAVDAVLGLGDLGELQTQSGFVRVHGRQRVGAGLAGLPGGEQGKGRAGALDVGFFSFQRGERFGEGAPAERGVSLVAQVFDGFGGQLQCATRVRGVYPRANRFPREDYGGGWAVLRTTGKPERTGIFHRGGRRKEGDGFSAGHGFGKEV